MSTNRVRRRSAGIIAVLRERPLPKMEGREEATFSIYWGEVSTDSDGPVEWCKPVPESDAQALASHFPALSLRTEPTHREAYVALPNARYRLTRAGARRAMATPVRGMRTWAAEHGIDPESSGLRISGFGHLPRERAGHRDSAPFCDFAVPFASNEMIEDPGPGRASAPPSPSTTYSSLHPTRSVEYQATRATR